VAKLLSARRLVYWVDGRTLLGTRHPPAPLASLRYFGLASARGSERFRDTSSRPEFLRPAYPCAIALRTSIGHAEVTLVTAHHLAIDRARPPP